MWKGQSCALHDTIEEDPDIAILIQFISILAITFCFLATSVLFEVSLQYNKKKIPPTKRDNCIYCCLREGGVSHFVGQGIPSMSVEVLKNMAFVAGASFVI